jgi:hypothetical protein
MNPQIDRTHGATLVFACHDQSMDPTLMFIAGRITGELGWADAAVISVLQLEALEPIGVPLVVVAEAQDITPLTARLISSVDAVGRPIMLVTDEPPDPAAGVWIEAQLMRSLTTNEVPKLAPDLVKNEVSDSEAIANMDMDSDQPIPRLAPDPFLELSRDPATKQDTADKPKQQSGLPQLRVKETKSMSASGLKPTAKSAKVRSGMTTGKSDSSVDGKASAEVFREFRSLAGE